METIIGIMEFNDRNLADIERWKKQASIENPLQQTIAELTLNNDKSIKTMQTKIQTIKAPEGFKIIRDLDSNGNEVISFNKLPEKPKEGSISELIEKVSEYRHHKKHVYYLDEEGDIDVVNTAAYGISFSINHNIAADIKAQQLNLIFKGLVEMYSEELDWENFRQVKAFISYDIIEDKIHYESGAYTYKQQGTTYASSIEVLKKVVAEMGKENVIFMLKNLR